jgi:hypothetical protein
VDETAFAAAAVFILAGQVLRSLHHDDAPDFFNPDWQVS